MNEYDKKIRKWRKAHPRDKEWTLRTLNKITTTRKWRRKFKGMRHSLAGYQTMLFAYNSMVWAAQKDDILF